MSDNTCNDWLSQCRAACCYNVPLPQKKLNALYKLMVNKPIRYEQINSYSRIGNYVFDNGKIMKKKHKLLIIEDFKKLVELADKEASRENNNNRAEENKKNNTCPRCSHNNVVDKIAKTKGGGEVMGNLFAVYGYSSIDTYKVNNCTKCGHQWEKYDYDYKDKYDILKDWTYDIMKYVNGDEWYKRYYEPLKEFYAETIRIASKKYRKSYVNFAIPLRKLKIHFKSVKNFNNQNS